MAYKSKEGRNDALPSTTLFFHLCFIFPILVLTFIQSGSSSVAHAATAITILPAQQYQAIHGWGTSMAWWAHWAGGLSDTQRNGLADKLFDPNTGIGLNVLRYNFGADGPGNNCHNAIATGKAGVYSNIPTYAPAQGSYDWTQDANQRWVLQAAQNRGANIFEGFVNAPPAWMLTNNCTSGANNNAENLSSAHYDSFAEYMTTIAQHFHDTWGLTLQTLAPFNEPTPGYWNYNGDQEGMNVSPATQNTIIKKLGARLDQTGVSAYSTVSASDDTSVDRSNNNHNAYDTSAKGYVTQYNTHTYGGSTSDRDYAYNSIGQGGNKRIWMSEWGTGDQGSAIGAALRLSQQILVDQQHLHPSSWVIWQAMNNYFGPGGSGNGGSANDVWGLATTDGNGNIIYPSRFYAMGNYSKFVRPGYKMIGNSDSNTFSAYDAGSNTLVLVSTNSSTSANSVTYDLTNFTNVGTAATPYRTSSNQNLAQLANLTITNKSFSTSLPAQSITTYVIPNVTYQGTNAVTSIDDAVQGSGLNQFNYQGSWGHCTSCGSDLYNGSNSWSGQGGDSVSIQFSGSRIRLYGTTDTNEGIGLVSIDNGPAKEVDFYAAKRAGNQFLWESSALGVGTHTLKLTVSGRKNPQSTNYWPALDRVEIEPVVTNNYVKILNRNSGKALDVSGQSTNDGALIGQWDYWGGTNQQWQIVDVGGGYVKIVNRNSGKVLDVTNQSTTNGASIIQYTDNGGTNQQWQIVDVGGGYVKIVNRNSGKVIDVSGQSTANGASIIQYTDNGGTNQQWQVLTI